MWKKNGKVVTILISAIALLIWLEESIRGVTESVKSIPLHYLWWGLGIIAGLALLVWLFWSLARRGYARYAGRAVRGIRPGWLIVALLLIGYSVLIYYKYPWHELEEMDERELKKSSCLFEVPDNIPSDIFMIDVHPGCPHMVKMKPKQMIVWWGDKAKFTSGWFYRERTTPSGAVWDKFRVFQARGVESVTIKIHRYTDPDPLWYTRQ